jgi:hypothetical protein
MVANDQRGCPVAPRESRARRQIRSTEARSLGTHRAPLGIPSAAVKDHTGVAGEAVLVAVHGNSRVAVVSWQGRLTESIAVGAGPHGIPAVRQRWPSSRPVP